MPITIDGTGSISGLSAGGLPDNSIITADIAAGAVTYAKLGTTEQGQLCKAWVNFNGTGVVAIRAQYNVSSITDNGTGRYAVNFTTAMPDANYCYTYGGKPFFDTIAGYKTDYNQTNTTTSLQIQTGSATEVADFTDVCVAIFR